MKFLKCRSLTARWLTAGALALAASLLCAESAHARPVAPALFCAVYGDAPACAGMPASCDTCHQGPPVVNAFGSDVRDGLLQRTSSPFADGDFEAYLAQVLMELETVDSDGDGFSNLEEIESGTEPGQSSSFPAAPECPAADDVVGLEYQICSYDYDYVYRKVGIDFCGLPPTFEEMEAFHQLGEPGQLAEIHALLDTCLDTEFWLGPNGVLWNVAHSKVRPIGSLTNFADFYNDYEYFTYTQIDDHDVRDVLVGQYLIERVEDGSPVRSVYQTVQTRDGQPMQPERRAGLLTSAWPLFYNTMFTALPRGTAAQAYRAFLGFNIASSEGLNWPISNEPVDFDGAGVQEPTCAGCHSTLDPLAYPFSRYNGIQGDGAIGLYMYDPDRIDKYFVGRYPAMASMPEEGYIFGQRVANLLEWAEVAANSEQFFTATTRDYWRLLVGDEPGLDHPEEYAEFTALWQELSQHHSVEQMLHSLIDTEAYGAP